MVSKWITILFLLCWATTLPAQRRKTRLPAPLKEISGLAFTPNGQLWALNDGGNSATLYRIDPQNGNILEQRLLPILNSDWEDLQSDEQGRLWIGDVGNNLNNRKDLRFFRYTPSTGALDSLLFSYPDQTLFPPPAQADRNFDCEAFVYTKDTLHLFTKSRFAGRHFAKHYALPAQPGQQAAVLRDSIHLPKRAVSGAALSHDGRTLVLVAYYLSKRKTGIPYTRATAYFFEGYQNTDFFSGKMRTKRLPKVLVARQFESVTPLHGRDWLFANEGILWQKQRLWKIRQKR